MAGLNTFRYDPLLVQPMREELTRIGFTELRTPAEVDAAIGEAADQSPTLVVVNSVCGCASGRARPALAQALQQGKRPARLFTVFAGQDADATDKARGYFTGYGPSSPSMGLFAGGRLVYMMERKNIEGRHPAEIAAELRDAFDRYC